MGRGRARSGPNIFDVARGAGVSTASVSLALNGRPGVGENTRSRILRVADDLGWEPRAAGRTLSGARAFAVGLVIARDPSLLSADPFFPAFIAGVETELAELGYALLLQVVDDDMGREAERYTRLARAERVDGVILSDLRFEDPRIALCERLDLPAVTLNRPRGRSPFPAVCQDDGAGVAAAVRHLAELGHVRIAYVSGRRDLLHGANRTRAWTQTMTELGLAADLSTEGDFTAASGSRATRELLTGPDRPSAIVYGNDVMAIAGVGVATELGLSLPDELSVVGYDDSELAAHIYPPLTSIRSDAVRWGRTATRALLDAIEGRGGDVELPPAQLVVRASTGAPLGRKERPS